MFQLFLILLLMMLVAVPVAIVTEQPDRPVGALSRQDAANYLGISTRYLDDLLSAGQIPKIKLGRKTLVRILDLDQFLASKLEGQ